MGQALSPAAIDGIVIGGVSLLLIILLIIAYMTSMYAVATLISLVLLGYGIENIVLLVQLKANIEPSIWKIYMSSAIIAAGLGLLGAVMFGIMMFRNSHISLALPKVLAVQVPAQVPAVPVPVPVLTQVPSSVRSSKTSFEQVSNDRPIMEQTLSRAPTLLDNIRPTDTRTMSKAPSLLEPIRMSKSMSTAMSTSSSAPLPSPSPSPKWSPLGWMNNKPATLDKVPAPALPIPSLDKVQVAPVLEKVPAPITVTNTQPVNILNGPTVQY